MQCHSRHCMVRIWENCSFCHPGMGKITSEHKGRAGAAVPWPELCCEDQCALTQVAERVFWMLAG